MQRRLALSVPGLVLGCFWVSLAQADVAGIQQRGKLDTVTVYRGQALVTRLVDVPAEAGLREVVVTDLPAQMLPGSIFAEGNEGVVVRSVRYRERPVDQDIREGVRELDGKIRLLQDEVEANTKQRELLTEQREYLAKLEQFTAPTASLELTHGVLNADTLKALSEFLLDGRRQLVDRELELNKQQRELGEQLALVERERQILTGDSARRMREAVVFVELRGDKPAQLRFGYLVSNASWTPSYNLRSGGAANDVTLEYNASIQQMSGEDWADVAMTLSTATPSLVAKAPTLTPLAITLSHQQVAQQQSNSPAPMDEPKEYAARKADLEVRRRQLEEARNQLFAQQRSSSFVANEPRSPAPDSGEAAPRQDAAMQSDFALNSVAAEGQVLDLLVRSDVAGASRLDPRPADEVSVTYALPTRTSLPSRADQQLVQIASLQLPAGFYKVAVPMLTQHVYDEATVTNASELVLLAGPISTYRADQFVGLGQIPTVASGESFTVGLGIDASLRAKRELAAKQESLQGGNRVVDFTYRLGIENFGSQPVALRLLDRMPVAKESDVKLTLVQPGPQLSADPAYLQADRKNGVLRWDVEIPARAVGLKQHDVEYQFRLEYDKQMSVAGLPLAEASR